MYGLNTTIRKAFVNPLHCLSEAACGIESSLIDLGLYPHSETIRALNHSRDCSAPNTALPSLADSGDASTYW